MIVEPGNKELVAQTLEHWKADADLAGVRDADALADGDKELAVLDGKGWGRRPVKVTLDDPAAVPPGLLQSQPAGATMDCSGRTHVMVPLPHFIDLGQGSAFIAAWMMPGNESAVGPPFFLTTANQNSPLPVSRFSA
jgi:hypothetical protein